MNDAKSGSTQVLLLTITDENTPANNPVIGQTATVAIRRLSDDKWYDFTANAWDTFAGYDDIEASNKQALTDRDDGSYGYSWNQATADSSAERQYQMIYDVPSGDYQGQAREVWSFRPTWSVAGDAMALTTAERTAISTAILGATITFPDSSTKTLETLLEEVWANSAGDYDLSGVNWTIKWPNASTAAMIFELDSATAPTSRTRI